MASEQWIESVESGDDGAVAEVWEADRDALYQAWCQAETKQKQRELLAEHYERETRNALAIAWWRHASGFSPEGGTPDTRLTVFFFCSRFPGLGGPSDRFVR